MSYTTTADLVGYTPAGIGAVVRPVEARLRDFVSVKDFGAIGDGTTDDTAAVQAALSSTGTIWFPAGTYKLTGQVTVSSRNDIQLVGYGAKITAASVIEEAYFHFDGCTRVHIEGLEFDQAQPTLGTYGSDPELYGSFPDRRNVALYLTGCNGVTVTRCRFTNLYTASIYSYGSSDLDVTHCHFSSPLQAQDQFLVFVHLQSVGGAINVSSNRFIGAATTRNDRSPCAVSASGVVGSLTIRDNYAEHCGRNNDGGHRLGVFDLYADGRNITVEDNVAYDCREQFMRLSTSVDCEVSGNTVTVAANADEAYSTMTIESGWWPLVGQPICKRIRVTDNTIIDASRRQAFAIGVLAYDWGGGPSDVEIAGNNIQGSKVAFYIQGPFDGIKILRNTVTDVSAFLNQTMQDSTGKDQTFKECIPPLPYITQAQSKVDGLRIEGNDITIRGSSAFVPVSISTHRTSAYTGTVGSFHFNDNRLSCASPGTTIALNVIFNASVAQGRFYAENNSISGYTTPFLLRSMKRAVLRNNHVPGFTALLNAGSSSYGQLDSDGNRTSDGARAGTVTLAGGTGTVNTSEILAGDVVRVSRTLAGGTLGHLSVGTITPGTSFVINSSSGGETSTVAWEIVGR